ncbi:hypothetical protein WEI85_36765 [Actinomycetes bacterium KLBMP 9797]
MFYVKDEKKDGPAAVLDWFDSESNRSDACVNNHTFDKGGWAACDKDFTENHEIFFRAARYNSGDPAGKGAWTSNLA